MGISTFQPICASICCSGEGKRGAGASLFASSATFCFLYLSFYLFLCFQLPSNVIVYHFC